jgi:hypothetical protein
MYLKFQIKLPAIIEFIVLYFVLRYRKKKYGYPFRLIKLHSGREDYRKKIYTKVDAEDWPKLSQYEWNYVENAYKTFYVFRIENGKTIYMHREIMSEEIARQNSIMPITGKSKRSPIVVDHKNRDGLDNRKSNLRLATRSQNNYNRRKKKGSSKYRGVCYCKRRKEWRGYITYNKIYKSLGYFKTEEGAARAYDEAAKIYHGEFAMLNFPDEIAGAKGERIEQLNSGAVEQEILGLYM